MGSLNCYTNGRTRRGGTKGNFHNRGFHNRELLSQLLICSESKSWKPKIGAVALFTRFSNEVLELKKPQMSSFLRNVLQEITHNQSNIILTA